MKKILLALLALFWSVAAQAQTDSFLALNGTFKNPFVLANTWTALQTFNGGATFSPLPTFPLAQNQFYVGNASNFAAPSAFTLGRGSLIELGASAWQTIAPGPASVPFVSNGAAADPSYQSLTNAGMAVMPAGTVKANPTGASALPVDSVAPALGVNGGTGGQITFNGSTSGSATIFVSATAGTLQLGSNAAVTAAGQVFASTMVLGTNGGTGGSIAFNGSTSGTLTERVPAAAGTPTITWGTGTGTPAVTASAPLAIVTATGNATCSTCATTTNGGALTATAPIAISAAGVISFDNTAWTTYTPSPSCGTATFTVNGSVSKTWGKVTHLQLDITFTALGTCTNLITFNLPNTSNSSGGFAGREVAGPAFDPVTCAITGGGATTAQCARFGGNNFANGERVIVSGVYENQ